MHEPIFRVRAARWEADGDALREIRQRVFVEEQKVPLSLEWDGRDQDAFHVLAEDDRGRAVGTARMLADGHIGRMAVLPEWRRRGIGSALLRQLLGRAREQATPTPFLNAQISAMGFYARFGFAPRGAEFTEAGIPHRRMVLTDPGRSS
jgi:predicted GNAT family N-acyltransferase